MQGSQITIQNPFKDGFTWSMLPDTFFLKAISESVLECMSHCNSVTVFAVMDRIHKHAFSFDHNVGLRQVRILTDSQAEFQIEFHQLCKN